MKQPLISVIVPCYKVEEYLPKCIESILSQTYRHLEILLVDDGSPDRSGEICDEYAARDSRIKVIHKENGGLSDARNVALDVMKGEYVTFIDSDDYVAEDYVEYLWNMINQSNADISAILDLHFMDDIQPVVDNSSACIKVLNRDEYLCKIFYQLPEVTTGAQCKLYRKNLFDRIRFPKGYLYEDLLTVHKIIMLSRKNVISNHVSYFYRERENSIISSPYSRLKYDSTLQIIAIFLEDRDRFTKRVRKALDCRLVSALFHLLLHAQIIGKKLL